MAGERVSRFLDDAASLAAIVRGMPAGDRDDYLSYGALAKEASFPNRKLVVYTLRSGRPADISVLTCGDLTATRIVGPVVDVSDEKGTVSVGVKPLRWRGRDLFIQVPQHFELKWTGKDMGASGVQFVPHYALLLKTRSKEFHQVEGHTYCVTLNKFRERFPDINVRY
jgi:hypothetical protein